MSKQAHVKVQAQQKAFVESPPKSSLLQRTCACGRHIMAGGECSTCRNEQTSLQRSTLSNAQVGAAPPLVHQVLRSPGQPLDATTRGLAEARFGHDFSRVRIHSDARAAASAEMVQALGYTVGQHIILGARMPSLGTIASRMLLAHELVHVQQQPSISSPPADLEVASPLSPAEQEAEALSNALSPQGALQPVITGKYAPRLYRLPIPLSPAGRTKRDEFEAVMKKRFHVQRIYTGTFKDQAIPGLTPDKWQSYDPGPNSPVYDWIIDAFNAVESQIGGVPDVLEIGFFDRDWEPGSKPGTAVDYPDVGGSFAYGQLRIYRRGVKGDKPLPIGRSNPEGRYPNAPVIGVEMTGSKPGAPLPLPTQQESVTRVVTHELGHGLVEATDPKTRLGSSPLAQRLPPIRAPQNILDDYKLAVGWTATGLFDIGVPAVQQALQHTPPLPPPAEYRITEDHWNDPRWIEQPISGYMVNNLGDDFAEAVMAYVNAPAVLKARSPRRYQFLDTNKDKWYRNLLHTPQRGDFPEPDPSKRLA